VCVCVCVHVWWMIENIWAYAMSALAFLSQNHRNSNYLNKFHHSVSLSHSRSQQRPRTPYSNTDIYHHIPTIRTHLTPTTYDQYYAYSNRHPWACHLIQSMHVIPCQTVSQSSTRHTTCSIISTLFCSVRPYTPTCNPLHRTNTMQFNHLGPNSFWPN
jgi:hypothetical protein